MREKTEKDESVYPPPACLVLFSLQCQERYWLPPWQGKVFKWFSLCLQLCAHLQCVCNAYQSKRKTVFQFLILFLKVVVLVRIAVRELVDLNFSVRQLLNKKIGIKKQSGKCIFTLCNMLAFMIFSFFFLTSDFVRQSAFARTGMRFTWHLHYQLGTFYFMLLHFQLGNLTFFAFSVP